MKNLKKYFLIISDWYCAIISAAVTLWLLCIVIIGGYIKTEIYWHNVIELYHAIHRFLTSNQQIK